MQKEFSLSSIFLFADFLESHATPDRRFPKPLERTLCNGWHGKTRKNLPTDRDFLGWNEQVDSHRGRLLIVFLDNKGFSSSNPRPAFNKTGGNAGGENREERNNRRNREMNGTTDFEKQPRQPARRNFDDGRKRQRDRQSGSDKTGVKSVDKRDGNGAHNWGSHKQDIDDINKPPTDDENKEGGEENVEDSTPAAPVEEEPKEMTLDEWKAQRQAQLVQPQYNLRKAGEGEDNAQWDKMKRLDKKTGDGETSRRDAEAAAAIKREADAKKKQVLEIDFHFNDGRRGGLGRRPNPGGRGTGVS